MGSSCGLTVGAAGAASSGKSGRSALVDFDDIDITGRKGARQRSSVPLGGHGSRTGDWSDSGSRATV